MITIGVDSNIDRISREMGQALSNQIPFAASLALNRTANLSRTALQHTMARVFDRPRPFTLNSLFVKNATKTRLVARVGHKEASPVNKYLKAEIEGGQRAHTGLENVISRSESGGRTPFVVPGAGAKLDAYGNVSPSIVKRVVEAARGKGGDVFIIPLGSKSGLSPGVYQRKVERTRTRNSGLAGGKVAIGGGSKAIPLLLFTERVQYKPIYDLEGVVRRTVNAEFGRQFVAAMEFASATAKAK